MRGLSDDEMADIFGLSPKLLKNWKRQYPDFKKAIEHGRTLADARVVRALFEKAIGYSHPNEHVHFDAEGVVSTYENIKHYPPDTGAIKMWLTNRQKEHWADRSEQRHGLADNALPGIRDESKKELMASILALVSAKPDKPSSKP
jgi:hypothetical protein